MLESPTSLEFHKEGTIPRQNAFLDTSEDTQWGTEGVERRVVLYIWVHEDHSGFVSVMSVHAGQSY